MEGTEEKGRVLSSSDWSTGPGGAGSGRTEEEEGEEEREVFNPVVPAPLRYVLNAGAIFLLAMLAFLFAFFA